MRLTIAIPTYNRNAVLLENLQILMPQLTSECRLLILDNCSDVPVSDTLQPLLANYGHVDATVIRHRVNVGGNANVMRCFELCKTEYLWVLGDDDAPAADAVQIIFEQFDRHQGCVFFNFNSGYFCRGKEVVTKGVNGFVRKVDSMANVFFISCGVYRMPSLAASVKVGYTYTYSYQSNITMLLTSLGKDGLCCLSDRQIVTRNPPANDQRWSFIHMGLGLMTALELPLEPKIRKLLAPCMRTALPPLRLFLVHLLMMSLRSKDYRTAFFFYDQLCYRLYYFDRSPAWRARLLAYRLVLRFPKAAYSAIDFYKSRKGSTIKEHVVVDPFARL